MERGGRGVDRHAGLQPEIGGELRLEGVAMRPGPDPAAAQNLGHRVDFGLTDVGLAEDQEAALLPNGLAAIYGGAPERGANADI